MTRSPAAASPTARSALLLIAVVTLWRIIELIGSPMNLSFDEAQYWDWSRSFAFGYFSKPPVVAWAIAATTGLFGHAEWAVRMGSPLAHAGTAFALFVLARRMFDARVGLLSALVFLTLPGVSLSAQLISTDPFLMTAWGWGLVLLHAALAEETAGRRATKAWLGLGVVFGLGLLAKYAMIAFPVSAAFAIACVPAWRPVWRRPGPWIALLVGFAVFSPNLAWNAANHFVSFVHTRANANLGAAGVHPLKALEFFGGQFGVFGPILFAALVWLTVGLFRPAPDIGAETRRDRILLAAFALPLILVMTGEGLLSRANANWAAPAYVAATPWVVGALVRAKKEFWIKASVILHLLAALAMVNFDGIVRLAGVELTAKTDPLKRVRGWDRMGEALGDLVRQSVATGGDPVLVFDERKILTPMLYYLAQPQPPIAKWNPSGHIGDHYDLTADLAKYRGREVLLVTRRSEVSDYAAAFSGPVRGPVVLSVPIRKDYALVLNVFRMGDFAGYTSESRSAPAEDADD